MKQEWVLKPNAYLIIELIVFYDKSNIGIFSL